MSRGKDIHFEKSNEPGQENLGKKGGEMPYNGFVVLRNGFQRLIPLCPTLFTKEFNKRRGSDPEKKAEENILINGFLASTFLCSISALLSFAYFRFYRVMAWKEAKQCREIFINIFTFSRLAFSALQTFSVSSPILFQVNPNISLRSFPLLKINTDKIFLKNVNIES